MRPDPTSADLPHGNCYRLAPQLIAGEYPGHADQAAARAKVARHLAAGITCFIDLTEAGELAPYADLLADQAGPGRAVVHRRMPIRDLGVPRTQDAMRATLDLIDAALADGHTVYLHCWGGIGRTGTVAGCWLVRHGLSGAAALEAIAGHWRGVAKYARRPVSPETDEQRAYVRAWRE